MKVQEIPLAQRVLIASLVDLLGREGRIAHMFETHISWVLVTEDVAYKFKKAVRYEFLDFSTLQARRHYCLEELRLNRRFSASLYLGLVCITGTPEAPHIDGSGAPLVSAGVNPPPDGGVLMAAVQNDEGAGRPLVF